MFLPIFVMFHRFDQKSCFHEIKTFSEFDHFQLVETK